MTNVAIGTGIHWPCCGWGMWYMTYDTTNLPNNMTIHSSMATKAPVLRPAEDRKAWAWQMLWLLRPLVFPWQTHTLRESVVVLLRGGSPPSATTTNRLKKSRSLSWLKPSRRRDTILAVLSVAGRRARKEGVWEMMGRWMKEERYENDRREVEWCERDVRKVD